MIKVFIGSGNKNMIETRVLEYSIKLHATMPVEIIVMNGDEDQMVVNWQYAYPANVHTFLKESYKSTAFTFYRFAIPAFCHHSGRAIYVDSDQLLLTDIRNLWGLEMEGNDILLRKAYGKGKWATSVMLMDCEKTQFDIPSICRDIDEGELNLTDLIYFTERFRHRSPIKLGPLSPSWNEFDRVRSHSHLVHFTNLHMQPWRCTSHPYEDLWIEHLVRAYHTGFVTDELLDASITNLWVRPDLRQLIESHGMITPLEKTKRHMRAAVSNLKFMGGLKPYLYNFMQ